MQIDLEKVLGLGVAGNFVGYLEQIHEESDYAALPVKEAYAPKGLFPFYIPVPSDSFLSTYPIGRDILSRPDPQTPLQAEAELALLCNLAYQAGKVTSLIPTHFAAFNDASLRKKTVEKQSQKKNWGSNSKGCAADFIAIDRFGVGGILDNYRLVAYLRRDGELHAFGKDSPVLGYTYFYDRLVDWLLDRLNHQSDQNPLESMPAMLKNAHYPAQALISIGAIRYTHFGESTFLVTGDEIVIATYDGTHYKPAEVEALLKDNQPLGESASVLRQVIV